jgi:hypothetical protein
LSHTSIKFLFDDTMNFSNVPIKKEEVDTGIARFQLGRAISETKTVLLKVEKAIQELDNLNRLSDHKPSEALGCHEASQELP